MSENVIICCPEIIQDKRLSLNQIKVLLALFSFRNKTTNLCFPSRESISKKTGIRVTTVSEVTTELVSLKWVLKKWHDNKYKYEITVPDADIRSMTWTEYKKLGGSTVHSNRTVQTNRTPEVHSNRTHNKDNLTEIIKNPPTPHWLDLEIWDEFKKHRKKVKKPMTEFAEKKMLIKLGKLKDEGHDPNKLLEESLINGWQGVFEPKKQTQPKYLSADERARLNTSWLDEEIKKSRGEHGAENERSNTGGIKVIQ